MAEGVESLDQCGPIRNSGGHLGQGYYLAKSLDSTDAESLLFTTTPAQTHQTQRHRGPWHSLTGDQPNAATGLDQHAQRLPRRRD